MPNELIESCSKWSEKYNVPTIDDTTVLIPQNSNINKVNLAQFSKSSPILTIGSFSKIIWGGLRVGWIRAQTQWVDALAGMKAVNDLGSSLVSQVIASNMVPFFDDAIQEEQMHLKSSFLLCERLFKEHLPDWTLTRPDGGITLWVKMPCMSSSELEPYALRAGVSIFHGSLLSPTERWQNYIRIPLSMEADILEEGIKRLKSAWHRCLEKEKICNRNSMALRTVM